MTINAIETRYAGCRFRSRLEARWAVFFNTLGVAWQYEPEGLLVGPEDSRRPYLPDFYLPALGTWVEVKGDPRRLDLRLIADAVDPKTGLGRPNPYYETTVLILGDIPAPGAAHLHWLASRQGYASCDRGCGCMDVQWAKVAFLAMPKVVTDEMGDTALLDRWQTEKAAELGAILYQFGRSYLQPDSGDPTKAQVTGLAPMSRRVDEAYRAARSARFEHGEAG